MMSHEERFRDVTVLGAAGKTESGILLLMAVEMADVSLKPENKGRPFVLNAVDVNEQALEGVPSCLRSPGSEVRRRNDPNTVLLTGFFRAYGPVNHYLD